MRLLLAFLVLVGCVAPAVFGANLTRKKKDEHHHTSSTSTSTSTTTTTTTVTTSVTTTTPPDYDAEDHDDVDDEGDIPYFDEIDVIKIHLPLPVGHWTDSNATLPCINDVNATFPCTDGVNRTCINGTDVNFNPDPKWHGGPPVSPEPAVAETPADAELVALDTVVIPDIATFDAVFDNRSRLADDIRVFAFGGVYEIIVNRTRNSVEVVMIRALQNATENASQDAASDVQQLEAASVGAGKRLQMTMRAPSVTGRGRATGGKHDGQEGGHGAEDEGDEAGKGGAGGRGDQNGDQGSEIPDGKFDAVFINGSALSGVDMGVVSFNSSGVFKLNVSMGDDFMSVIISKIGEQMKGSGVDMPNNLRGILRAARRTSDTQPPQDDGTGSSSAGTILLTVMAVGAVAVLGAAILVSRSRARSRVSSFARRGEDYGSVETAVEAISFDGLRS